MNPGSRVVHIEPSIKSQASHASTPHSRPGGGRSSRSPVSRGATPSSLDGLNISSRYESDDYMLPYILIISLSNAVYNF